MPGMSFAWLNRWLLCILQNLSIFEAYPNKKLILKYGKYLGQETDERL